MAVGEIRVLLADDHRLFREGLVALLGRHDGLRVEGEVSNGLEAVEQVLLRKPDVVVLDILMPAVDGIEAARRIVRSSASSSVFERVHRPRTRHVLLNGWAHLLPAGDRPLCG